MARYRIGIIRRNYADSDVEILYDYIENKATVKRIIEYGIRHQSAWEFIHGSYFAEMLIDGVWTNITDYWNNLAAEGVEQAFDDGRMSQEELDRFFEGQMRYGDSEEVDYILDSQGRFTNWYCS